MTAPDPNSAFRPVPELRTQRLLLRQFRPEDLDDIWDYASDPRTTVHTIWDTHRSLDDTRAFLASALARQSAGGPPHWAIQELEGTGLIGTCGFVNLAPEHLRGEIGYVLSPKFWGRGYGTEAARAIIAYGFTELGLNRIEARCAAENAASARVLEKAGMRFEGLLRRDIVVRGMPRDARLYAVLRQDWE